MSLKKIAIIDLNVTKNSPAGSCVLEEINSLLTSPLLKIDLYTSNCELFHPHLNIIYIKCKSRINLFNYIKFYLICLVRVKSKYDVIQSTQGQYPFSNISYAHFCHQSYLKNQLRNTNTNGLRKSLRFLTHIFLSFCESITFKNANLIVVPSVGLYNEICKFYPRSINKLRIINNPINLNEFSKCQKFNVLDERRRLGLNNESFVINFSALGDFSRKGLDIIFNAVKKYNNKNIKILVVGGKSSEINEYKNISKSIGLSDQVIFTGFKTDIKPYLWISDVFILLSSYEIFPLVVIQAAAAGLPIISTPVYGVEEYLVDNYNGFCINRDLDELILKINFCFKNPYLLKNYSLKIQDSIKKYDVKDFHFKWLDLYLNLFTLKI